MIKMYDKSGKIVAKVREMAVKKVREDMKILELVELIENEIRILGGEPAFPCNVSVNEVTAHYTSPANDESLLKRGDLVKIDLGAQVDGYIADSAITVLVGNHDSLISPKGPLSEEEFELQLKMIETAHEALQNAISTVKDGVEVGKIGEVVQNTVNAQNLNPVSNLTGHSMDQWILHSGISIPNIKDDNKHKIEEGDVLAIEPFVTNGVGRVVDMKATYIFRFLRDRPLRVRNTRKLLDIIVKNYRNLPFAQRWLSNVIKDRKINIAMKQLIDARAVYPYHVLKEKSDARVAQAEHTVIVEPDGCKIITE